MSAIVFQCYSCHATLKVGGDKAGKKAKCRCGTILTIPAATQESATPAENAKADEITAAASNGRARRDAEDDEAPPPRRRPTEDDEYDDEDRPKRRRGDDDDDLDDRPRKKRRRDDEDDDLDDDRPRKRSRRGDDEDDDDRPSRRRRRDEVEDDDLDDRPRKKRRRDDDDYDDEPRRKKGGWKDVWPRVRLGFLLAFIGTIVYAGGYGLDKLAEIISGMLFISGGIENNRILNVMSVLSRIGILVAMGGLITAVVGYVFWIFVTNKNAGLGFAIATLATAGLNVILFILFSVVPTFDTSGDAGIVMMAHSTIVKILMAASLAAVFILSAFYVRAIAKTLKERDLSERFSMLVIMSSVWGGVQAFLPLLVMAFHPTGGADGWRTYFIISLILNVIVTGLHVFQLVLFIKTFNEARAATDRR